MHRVAIPQIFENMEEATIGKWLKNEGEAIAIGDPLCELITEKTTLDLQAEAAGQLLRQVVPEKSVVPTGYIVALIGEAGAALPDIDAENAALLAKKAELPQTETHPGGESNAAIPSLNVPSLHIPAASAAAPAGGSRVRATPAARRAAKVANVSIEDVAAAFPDKVLSEEDVRAFASR
jgi:pyruvate/2-oxoglutarate dehydrogenase complex dihydrolipoamide acyltransferase (E2) component